MRKGKGLWWSLCQILVLLTLLYGVSCKAEANCVASRCGVIANISHPFRLRNDPSQCGESRFELTCKDNTTLLLPLYSGTYRVLGINYDNFTVRLIDTGIQPRNISSLPRYFLSRSNFSDSYDSEIGSDDIDPYGPTQYPDEAVFRHVIYLNCSDPVRDDARYVDTSPYGLNWDERGDSSKGFVYAVVGDLAVKDLKPQCRLKFVATASSSWLGSGDERHGASLSYGDIHEAMSFGFEVSWWKRACVDHPCPFQIACVYNSDAGSLQCLVDEPSCLSPMGINDEWDCGRYMPKLRIFAEDYIYGIYKGLHQILGEGTYDHYTDYDFSLTQFAINLGVVTGRFIIPYMMVRVPFGFIFLAALLIYTCRRRHLSVYENIEDFLQLHNLIPIRYSYKELKTMTKGFKNKLGQGGFGKVYKGKLSSGLDVAIKMLGKSEANGQDFISEVATIGRIHHFNVVRFVGFCVEGRKRALVYEFMPNGSLDKYIFSKEGSVPLSYEKIYEISLGVARGIAYLHHGCDMQILHFDIKPHNILLDENFTPKVSDFGLARLYPIDDSIVTMTAARGTIGYMAPELFYKNIGGVSYKADVYSFGMLLMEMAGRRRNLNPHAEDSSQLYFPLWVYDQFNEEKDIEIEDLTKEEKDLARKMFIVALWCIQMKPIDRPSMKRVVEMLEADDVESLEMPPKPSLYPNEIVAVDNGSSLNQTTTSSDIMHSSNNLGEFTDDYEE
ncbi:LEAF RUST 10 DISEASE-RESISTANCE LOCUS RECEPTOR-LIKE PROTEIN KINASE-like 2.1 [Senna tora]|uniref:LEAF RUST 10 DISEASE-RESISTANCE LOCUS RECEPTOR-LIKE PROTEIN KINASE-like 2.1 n=1 Tax=Senna tora TaxID=362788 RepID=A0A834SLU6_9FABA|nr:LEAF RUST 10 DISEASE-RESISTANCE LOCUS RECEPTOR-LIKE PROTEIN KINASE-like 2.1 [Senna tora]